MTVESRIGATMARLRRRAGLSQAELAELARAPLSTVVGVESGAIEPPPALVARLAAAVAGTLRAAPGLELTIDRTTRAEGHEHPGSGCDEGGSTCTWNRAGRG